MVFETTNHRTPLLPDRHPQHDLFICDVLDAIPKDDIASMEHPIFSLSTKPDHRILEYAHNGSTIEIAPSVKGLATIHDKDVLIYCISQLIAKMNAGEEPKRELFLTAHDLLVATNRETSGNAYRRLVDTFDRLSGTRIKTNIKTADETITSGFGLVDSWRIIRKTDGGRMVSVKVTLSEWMFNSVVARSVLTLHRDYFRLRKPLERRMYELARKHCGRQDQWKIGLALLQKKTGSASTLKEFRRLVGRIVEENALHGHIPDYDLTTDGDMVVFQNRDTMQAVSPALAGVHLDPDIYHDARLVAPGWDVYELEREWRAWMTEPPRDPNRAFIGFCKTWQARRGSP